MKIFIPFLVNIIYLQKNYELQDKGATFSVCSFWGHENNVILILYLPEIVIHSNLELITKLTDYIISPTKQEAKIEAQISNA